MFVDDQWTDRWSPDLETDFQPFFDSGSGFTSRKKQGKKWNRWVMGITEKIQNRLFSVLWLFWEFSHPSIFMTSTFCSFWRNLVGRLPRYPRQKGAPAALLGVGPPLHRHRSVVERRDGRTPGWQFKRNILAWVFAGKMAWDTILILWHV